MSLIKKSFTYKEFRDQYYLFCLPQEIKRETSEFLKGKAYTDENLALRETICFLKTKNFFD